MFSFITDPLLQFLLFLYRNIGDFGLSIIAFTCIVRVILAPLSVPAIKSQKKIQNLKPELDKLKKQFGHDKKKHQEEQMKLYQLHKINPAAGCIPYLLQFIVLIALYQVLNTFLNTKEISGLTINTLFLGFDLAKPDKTYILPILAGVTQLVLSLMILPGVETHNLVPDNAKSKKIQELNKKEEGVQDMAEAMQKQMVFMMPVVTGIATLSFPAGLGMYWVVSTIFSIGQQWIISGPGGLFIFSRQAMQWVRNKISPSSTK